MTYIVSLKSNDYIVSLDEAKEYLNVCFNDNDDVIQGLINSSVTIVENKIHRDLLTTTWINYRNSFYEDLTLRRGAFQSVESIEYLVDGVYTTLSTDKYSINIGGAFGEICDIDIPTSETDCNLVKITFKTGFGDCESDIPEDIKLAMKTYIAFMYSNRGDCGSATEVGFASSILNKYNIIDIAGTGNFDCL